MRMKILYAIQGTGNGHVSRAREIIPHLQRYGDVELLISGTQSDVKLSQALHYQLHGFSFIFGKKGGVDHWETWKRMDLGRFVRDLRSLPLKSYDLIINDFEPVTAWACKVNKLESVGLSHQAAFQSDKVPRPKSFDWAQFVLKYYAPATNYIGLHFDRYDDYIHTPVIRSEIRALEVSNDGHYTVYLPAIADALIVPLLKKIPVRWEVFSKHSSTIYTDGNVSVSPIDNQSYLRSLASCAGLFTGGGFEGPAEALYLGKKVLLAPMKYQYEQQCNAFALKQYGIPVIWGSDRNWLPSIMQWVNSSQQIELEFPDNAATIVDQLVNKYAR